MFAGKGFRKFFPARDRDLGPRPADAALEQPVLAEHVAQAADGLAGAGFVLDQ